MTRKSSYEFTISEYAQTARDERAVTLTRFGFLAIAGADRAVRRTLSAVASGVGSLVSRWNDFSERRAIYLALSKLDDRLLQDIGLTRADIEGRAAELPVHGPEAADAALAPVPRPAATVHEFKRAA
ncbi:MAG: DUF1127 domain-containing protein [Dongiaceae bacterium]